MTDLEKLTGASQTLLTWMQGWPETSPGAQMSVEVEVDGMRCDLVLKARGVTTEPRATRIQTYFNTPEGRARIGDKR